MHKSSKALSKRSPVLFRRAAWRASCSVLAGLALLPLVSQAEKLPLWEAGIGVGGLTLPQYRGSDQYAHILLPTPYLVYRGDVLKADRNGLRAQLFDSDKVQLNLSANATLPVYTSDNVARRGMPDLRPTVELGGNIAVHLWRNASRDKTLELRLPLRAAITLESHPRNIGWVFGPNLNLDIRDPAGMRGWRMGILGGPLFQTRDYNSYFYSVAPNQALPDRPAFQARGGYSGSQLTLALSKRFPGYWVGAFTRYDDLHHAAFEDSPLVKRRSALSAGLAISWIIGQSRQTVDASE